MQSDRRGDRRGGPGDRGGPGGRGDRRGVPGGRSDLDAYGGPPRGFGGPPPMMRLDDRVDGPIRPMKSLVRPQDLVWQRNEAYCPFLSSVA